MIIDNIYSSDRRPSSCSPSNAAGSGNWSSENWFSMPIYAAGKDDVFVGRIRRDESKPKCINLWIVADNLRKGAATNAVQIAEHVLKNFL